MQQKKTMAESKETWPLAKKEAAINNQSDAGEEEEDHCQHTQPKHCKNKKHIYRQFDLPQLHSE